MIKLSCNLCRSTASLRGSSILGISLLWGSSLYLLKSIPWRSGIPIFVWAACWFLSIFMLMPAEIPDNNNLPLWSGVMIVIIGIAVRWLDLHAEGNKYWVRNTGSWMEIGNCISHFGIMSAQVVSVLLLFASPIFTQKISILVQYTHPLKKPYGARFDVVPTLFPSTEDTFVANIYAALAMVNFKIYASFSGCCLSPWLEFYLYFLL